MAEVSLTLASSYSISSYARKSSLEGGQGWIYVFSEGESKPAIAGISEAGGTYTAPQ